MPLWKLKKVEHALQSAKAVIVMLIKKIKLSFVIIDIVVLDKCIG